MVLGRRSRSGECSYPSQSGGGQTPRFPFETQVLGKAYLDLETWFSRAFQDSNGTTRYWRRVCADRSAAPPLRIRAVCSCRSIFVALLIPIRRFFARPAAVLCGPIVCRIVVYCAGRKAVPLRIQDDIGEDITMGTLACRDEHVVAGVAEISLALAPGGIRLCPTTRNAPADTTITLTTHSSPHIKLSKRRMHTVQAGHCALEITALAQWVPGGTRRTARQCNAAA
ncbi:hypothetical protein P280DRAFT_197032 [Massarina eburnea CBS 473.64]|uniref:Uncharacterized protein n=1 Tax=Massarina eburnea CBS 473.64 TaxID=1395130 RepID=A0A6A6RJZ7_9PLEO|nr:hypothetical protein P280DRAFT_197032 [Massarina eburnea CBS 473.64]